MKKSFPHKIRSSENHAVHRSEAVERIDWQRRLCRRTGNTCGTVYQDRDASSPPLSSLATCVQRRSLDLDSSTQHSIFGDKEIQFDHDSTDICSYSSSYYSSVSVFSQTYSLGLLLPPDLGGPTTGVPWGETGALTQHLHARKDLEAGHILLQRQGESPTHHHCTQQVCPALPGRPSPLLLKVYG